MRTASERSPKLGCDENAHAGGEAGTEDVIDASVILCARQSRAASIVTSDVGDLRRLDPNIELAET